VWGESLAKGAANRAADLGPLDVVAGGLVAIGDDVAGVRDFARPLVALYVGGMGARGRNFYNDLACRYGFEDAAKEIQDLYLDGKKKEAVEAVPDELADAISLVGPVERIKERYEVWKQSPCTVMLLGGRDRKTFEMMVELAS
jgi:alkanesulfonate monooxygenase SsuD/methylene tetrahydromethanopterin reductase-like flavin-dependent oxidoreductase (luciferase family)